MSSNKGFYKSLKDHYGVLKGLNLGKLAAKNLSSKLI